MEDPFSILLSSIPPFSAMMPVALSIHAMAARFEVVLYGDDPVRLRAAGEEAPAEIERLDRQLSFYRPESDISWINAHAAESPVKVEPRLFRLLQLAAEISEKTGGVFDVTIAPLMRVWGFVGGTGGMADPGAVREACSVTGMGHVHLDPEAFTINFDRPGVELDLGAIGKGYAVEKASELLRDAGVTSALLHGGTSTVCGIGTQPDGTPWRVAVRDPANADKPLDVVDLADTCLSVSAVHGKSFTDGTVEYGHVVDPRTGRPARGALAAAVIGPSATVCDALSTALLVLGETGIEVLSKEFPGYQGKVTPSEER